MSSLTGSSEVRKVIAEFQEAFVQPVADKALGKYFDAISKWRERREAQVQQYGEAAARAAAHEETLHHIQELESRVAEINESADAKAQQLSRLGDPAAAFASLSSDWKTVHGMRADLLERQCGELTAVSNSKLRATLRRAADLEPLANRLKEFLKGSRTRGERIDRLVEQVTSAASPLDTWHGILDEFHNLA